MQKGYEYDDNIYNLTEGGTPTTIIFDKKEAQRKAIDLEIQMLKEVDIQSYSYDIDDSLNQDADTVLAFLKSINEKYGLPDPKNRWDRFGEYQLNPKASDEDAKKFLSMISIRFYEVAEVDVDVQSLRDHQISQIL